MSQSQSAAPCPAPTPGFLPFESPCGRRGCPEIFKYEGIDPFGGLEALVKAHKPHCVSRILGATGRCDTGWQPSREMMEQWQQPNGGAVYTYRGQSVGATEEDEMNWKASQTNLVYRTPDASDDGDVHASDDEMSIRSRSDTPEPPCRKQKRPNKRRLPSKVPLGPHEVHIKKSSHSEAYRKAALENDPWTQSVEPTKVVCAGCEKTIRLDQRSRYYPGLWEKHRDRCDDVEKGRAQKHKTGTQCPGAEAVNELKPLQGSRCPLEDGQEATVGMSYSEYSE
ncbi:hypothetical protein DFH09DRAFT_1336486 [Mycena vulgaris]|nr:hypothetical protein DFH09DRAFT_1336486 [Mycena vulgaris]